MRNHNLRLEWWDPGELADNPANWRRHPPTQVEALKGALAEVGWAGALLYNERTGRLIDGHLRKAVADGPVPVLVGDWSEEDERKILATLDPLGAMAETDRGALAGLLHPELDGTLAAMMAALTNGSYKPLTPARRSSTTDEQDETNAVQGLEEAEAEDDESISERGQIWQLGRHRVMCGDATEEADHRTLLGDISIDLVLTDPPYGVGIDYGAFEDTPENLRTLIKGFLGLCLKWPPPGHWALWDYPRPKWMLGWVHLSGNGRNPWGFTLYNPVLAYGSDPHLAAGRGCRPDTLILPTDRGSLEGHPTIKPLPVWEWLLERGSISYGDKILDPFLGSGTTVIACEKLGRICYGMDIYPRYVDLAIKRWEAYTGQKAVKVG